MIKQGVTIFVSCSEATKIIMVVKRKKKIPGYIGQILKFAYEYVAFLCNWTASRLVAR